MVESRGRAGGQVAVVDEKAAPTSDVADDAESLTVAMGERADGIHMARRHGEHELEILTPGKGQVHGRHA